jgi:RNA polymerase sigma-70 factor (ECF subfamily)
MSLQPGTEQELRQHCEEGRYSDATALAIRSYGPEILGFLIAHHNSEEDGEEVFSRWSERIFRALPRFGWAASFRTWAYAVARNLALNYQRGQRVRGRHESPALSDELAAAVHQVRTATLPHLRTEAKSRLVAIRDALPPEDRMLLVLRVDKRLEWKELARVMLGEENETSDTILLKESQRLRKRFQILKEKLVETGKREGILDRS